MRNLRSKFFVGLSVLLGVVLLAFMFASGSSRDEVALFPPPPQPNGYEELLSAARLLQGAAPAPPATFNEPWADYLKANEAALSAARSALALPGQVALQFNTNYLAVHMNDLSDLKALAQLLNASGKQKLASGQIPSASEDYLNLLRFGALAARGGLVIDGLVREAIQSMGIKSLIEVLPQLPPSECRQLLEITGQLAKDREPFEVLFARDQAFYRRTADPRTKRLFQWMALIPGMKRKLTAEEPIRRSIERGDAKFSLFLIAVALQVYKAEHGQYPADLRKLSPDYLTKIPNDPFNQAEFVYRPAGESYRLYSVGPDGKDDGGKPLSRPAGAAVQPGDILLE